MNFLFVLHLSGLKYMDLFCCPKSKYNCSEITGQNCCSSKSSSYCWSSKGVTKQNRDKSMVRNTESWWHWNGLQTHRNPAASRTGMLLELISSVLSPGSPQPKWFIQDSWINPSVQVLRVSCVSWQVGMSWPELYILALSNRNFPTLPAPHF